jgi:hypothetical protein
VKKSTIFLLSIFVIPTVQAQTGMGAMMNPMAWMAPIMTPMGVMLAPMTNPAAMMNPMAMVNPYAALALPGNNPMWPMPGMPYGGMPAYGNPYAMPGFPMMPTVPGMMTPFPMPVPQGGMAVPNLPWMR